MVYLAIEGKARRQIIQLEDERVIVKKGLGAGQTVIVRGNEQLSDGKNIDTGGKIKGGKSEVAVSKGDRDKVGKSGKPGAVDAASPASKPTKALGKNKLMGGLIKQAIDGR